MSDKHDIDLEPFFDSVRNTVEHALKSSPEAVSHALMALTHVFGLLGQLGVITVGDVIEKVGKPVALSLGLPEEQLDEFAESVFVELAH